jgi:peptide/nickel transport system substrate-binding protein
MKKNIERVLAILLCCVMLLAFAACKKTDTPATTTPPASSGNTPAPGEPTPPPEPPPATSVRDTMTVAVANDGASLDPIDLGGGAPFKDVSRLYAEPLFDIDEKGNKVWVLATAIEEVTPIQWIVHLREGIKFSNGNPWTADDVLFTLDIHNNHPIYPPSIPALNVAASRKLDDYTVELNFDSYDLSVVYNFPTIQFYDAESYVTDDYVMNPIGTGPYLVTEYVINSHCYLKADPNYWGTAGKIENLHFRVINEPAQIVNALTTGTVDVVTIPSQDVSYVQGLPDYKVILRSTGSSTALWFNTTTNSIFQNEDARRAASHAIDRQAIANLVYFGNAELSRWPLPMATLDIQPQFVDMDDTYKIGYDVELAKQYAEKAGIVGKDVKIITNGTAETITMAEIVQQSLKEIGVNASINNYDVASGFSNTQDTTLYDIFFSGLWVPSNTAAQQFFGWYTYMPSLNQGVWEGKDRFAELAAGIMAIYDDAERAAAVAEMTGIFAKAVPWYALIEPQTGIGYNKDLAPGPFMAAGNTYYGDWAWTA